MRDRVVRGGAIAAAGLVVLAAACSSSGSGTPHAGDTIPTVSAPTGGPVSTVSLFKDPRGTGVVSTDPGSRTPMTNSSGTYITTPSTTEAPTTTTQAPTTTTTTKPVQYVLQWQFAADYRTHPGTNPFADYLDGPKVWSLRESDSLSRNGNYKLLPHYARTFGTSGVSGWYGDSSGCVGRPSIAANTVEAPATVCGVDIHSHAAFVYPGQSHMAVVAWTSLFDGNIRIAAGIADLDPSCGDGVHYYIDKGTQSLSAITLTNRNSVQLDPITTSVTFGQPIYFIVDPTGTSGQSNNDCDTTQLSIIINRLQK